MKKTPLMLAWIGLMLTVSECRSLQPGGATKPAFEIIAYYAGDGQDLSQYRFDQLTQVIYSFCHLNGNQLAVDNTADSMAIRNLVALKRKHPNLKVLLSLGGWCGCKQCSPVFSDASNREAFANSVLHLLKTYQADGLDLDWEYPAIEGCPEHPFSKEDRDHFTELVRSLRKILGKNYQISFAAGGFSDFFDYSIDWPAVMPYVDRVNLMSYDLVSGFSTRTGHHTALYSTSEQASSVKFGVDYLIRLGVPRHKIVIGGAFYGRVWEGVAPANQGKYQSGKFKSFVPFKQFATRLSPADGFIFYRDTIAEAPYAYSEQKQEYATFDDAESLRKKTWYARREKLGGIMFWQLTSDHQGILLDAIYSASKKTAPAKGNP